jgi:hypothetical protein
MTSKIYKKMKELSEYEELSCNLKGIQVWEELGGCGEACIGQGHSWG